MFAADNCRGRVEHAATVIGHISRHVMDPAGNMNIWKTNEGGAYIAR
jgi:hypothetical protein